jgi:hypothetical protein
VNEHDFPYEPTVGHYFLNMCEVGLFQDFKIRFWSSHVARRDMFGEYKKLEHMT